MKQENKNTVLSVLYTVCFFFLCVIDWMTGSMQGRVQFVSTNCTGVVFALIILSGYNIREFVKPVYAVWTVIILIIAPIAIYWGVKYYPYKGQFISALLNICIYGYLVIRVILKQLNERKSTICWTVFFCWVLMIILMLLSRNEAIWPLWFGAVFGCFYLTEYEQERKQLIYSGLVNGIILGFFVIQGAALLFRPYDIVRYQGMYLNCNINALFYVMTCCAFFCKYFTALKEKRSIAIRGVLLLFSGAMFGFVILTGSRSAMVTLVVTIIPFLICLVRLSKKKIKTMVIYLSVLLSMAVISIPITYAAVRFMPTVHLHPIFFMNEYNDSNKVHSGEPRDSDKYISFNQMIGENLIGRFSHILPKVGVKASDILFPPLIVQAMELSEEEPAYLIKEGEDLSSVNLRYQIHKWYFDNLNFLGHSNSEHGVPLLRLYTAPHAHNWWLQLTFNFGLPVGVLLLCKVALYIKTFFCFLFEDKEEFACIIGCFITAFLTFGFFEMDFSIGQLPFAVFFMLFSLVLQTDESMEEYGTP